MQFCSVSVLETGSELLFLDRQGCLPSDTLFDIFLERIIRDALEAHKTSDSIVCRIFIYFRFADDIAANDTKEEEEAGGIATSMDTICTR